MADYRQEDKLERIVVALHEVNVNLEGLRSTLQNLHAMSLDHEGRLRIIERWQNNLTPVLAAMTFLLGVIFTQVMERIF